MSCRRRSRQASTSTASSRTRSSSSRSAPPAMQPRAVRFPLRVGARSCCDVCLAQADLAKEKEAEGAKNSKAAEERKMAIDEMQVRVPASCAARPGFLRSCCARPCERCGADGEAARQAAYVKSRDENDALAMELAKIQAG
eukprot:589326-Rhodomonas_salina.2